MTYKGFAEPRYLITPDELSARLRDVTLIDVRPGEDYANGHIETALHFDFYGVSLNDTSDDPLNAFLWMVENLFGFRGVDRDRTVVFYDHES
ncbi:MAG: rhodanese-like domain-containing protein, partial [Nitrospinota bacterium]|nr:rhodanese-like domain-containing protein [Nitrospinota bacterium]